jgi:hypothetical protein
MSTTGYDTNDPLKTKDYGYRSEDARQLSTFSGVVSDISYNGFKFPPFCKCKATIVPEYTKNNQATKWLVVAITVEFIVTQWDARSSSHPTIDSEMAEIRQRLTQPGQVLNFYLQGLGNIQVGDNTLNLDVNYGPKPQVLDWEPLGGGLAARCEWLCVTWLDPCYGGGNSQPQNRFIDFSYELEWTLDKGGFLSRVVTGEMEIAAIRQANSGDIHAQQVINLSLSNAAFDQAIANVKSTFPRMTGFHREENFKIDKTKKRLTYIFTDTEIPTDQPFPKGVLDMQLDEELTSSFEDKGFLVWTWNLSGTITVPNAGKNSTITQHKSLAFFAAAANIRERLDRAIGQTYVHGANNAGEAQSGGYARGVTVLPDKVKFGNAVYGNSIDIDISFRLYCTADLIFAASGMFDTVNATPGRSWADWAQYLKDNGLDVTVSNMVPNREVVVDLCHPLTGPIGPTPIDTSKKDRDATAKRFGILGPRLPNKESTWLDYRNTFYFMDRHFTAVGPVLSPGQTEIQQGVPNGDPAASTKDTKPDTTTSQSRNAPKPSMQTPTPPIHYVTMVGSAIRLGYPIEAPVLESVGGVAAILTGDDLVGRHTMPCGFSQTFKLQPGTPGNRSATVPMYKLSWRRTYTLTEQPRKIEIRTSGNPANFS